MKDLSTIHAGEIAIEARKKSEAYKEKKELSANMIKQAIEENAEARLQVAKDKKIALSKECGKELAYSGAMQPMREHEQKMNMSKSLLQTA